MQIHQRSSRKVGGKSVAVCFFGIPRAVNLTRDSIKQNVIAPIREFATVRTYAHYFDQAWIDNPRSAERGRLDEDGEIDAGQITIREAPDACLEEWRFEDLKTFGDNWSDGFASLRNLVHQLHSLRKVAQLAIKDEPDCLVLVRPDLWYYDSLGPTVAASLRSSRSAVWLPNWQTHGGENDRFAVACGHKAVEAYAGRITRALEYCETRRRPLGSHSLLSFALSDVKVRRIPARAARVRIHGAVVAEGFQAPIFKRLHYRIDKAGLPPVMRSLFRRTIDLTESMHDVMIGRKPVPKSATGELKLAYPQSRVRGLNHGPADASQEQPDPHRQDLAPPRGRQERPDVPDLPLEP